MILVVRDYANREWLCLLLPYYYAFDICEKAFKESEFYTITFREREKFPLLFTRECIVFNANKNIVFYAYGVFGVFKVSDQISE